MIGRLLGPNITRGDGGRTAEYTTSDWDRIVRHGVLPDGRPAAMPAIDFLAMSDQELSDIVAWITSQPAIDNTVAGPSLGPLGKVLIAVGALPLSADEITDHEASHVVLPPATEVSEEFGAHLAGVCAGCHRATMAGGPIPGGDPSWPPAANLTSHADGLAEWTHEQFVALMRTGLLPDRTEVAVPMSAIVPYGQQMTDVELEALWLYLQSMPPLPDPG